MTDLSTLLISYSPPKWAKGQTNHTVFAKVNRSDALLFGALASAAGQRADDFNMQSLCNTVWALAAAGQDGGGKWVVYCLVVFLGSIIEGLSLFKRF